MKKATLNRIVLIISIILIATFLLSACDSPPPRIPITHAYNPGAPFSTNFNYEDPRRQVRCAVIFEVIDESAVDELTEKNYVIRNAVLSVLGELTMPELTTHRDFDDIAERLVARANEDLGSHIDLIIGAYFTEFALT